ncbi:putative outer membrane starch-binding protein [Dyadobacter jejuensis]|uniref:Putative outer membrane starch-binding protein n=1 Tax=Dyadobacter jejuensis TaxID=1082580 RepID=A0A316B0B1_9BACT|nr:RagB/SusD family nutrient uptake outer membrane protein [Dyadobacter jejuensis]PWJ55937.1 putative outer membrane starch-binding protein [Dyadobacter jejuensis]
MKFIVKLRIASLICLGLTPLAGCQDFLDENSISTQTSESYFVDATGYEDLVRACYPLLRDISRQRDLVYQGTDLFTNEGWHKAASGNTGNALNQYDVRFNSSNGSVNTLWNTLYSEIGRTNTAISRVDNIEGMDEALKLVRVSEAKFLRAFSYFHLVQQFGDVPMPLTESTTFSKEVTRVPAAEVYAQIIKDLTEAEQALPVTATDYGRATKGAAQFLLARVYLTRGWNFKQSLGGSNADFTTALAYADKVIAAYPLAANYTDLFPKHSKNPLKETFPTQNDRNPEIVFAVQYSDDVLTYDGGNNAHSIFGSGAEDTPGTKGRSSDYNRHLNDYTVSPSAYRLYDPQLDTRYAHNFVQAIYALLPVKDFKPILGDANTKINIAVGDTVVYFSPWNKPATIAEKGIDVGGKKHYAVLNTDQFAISAQSAFHNQQKYPMMWKFWEPGIPYGDAYGTLDFILFRSAEAYLIAAEAILKGATGAKLGGAEVYYNKVVDRALGTNLGADPKAALYPGDYASLESKSYRATAANISIDLILDERARELLAEGMRWYDLKRTNKLIERAKAMNPWTRISNQIQEFHLLRPIPQQELDRSSSNIPQNEGY